MKSPFSQKTMPVKHKEFNFTFRKEQFTIRYHYYYCSQTDEEFTDDRLDEINISQVYNQYREKYGVPFPEEISAIREKYNVSASRMSEILGLGANTYRLYESGEMPSVANGRLILSIDKPETFIEQVEASAHFLSEKEQQKLISHSRKIKEEEVKNFWDHMFEEKIFPDHKPSKYNGYKIPDMEKISEVISYFGKKGIELYKTKLNKLLFYADFLSYKRTAYSITGITYKAIPYGPVPSEYDKLFIKLCDDGKIDIETIQFKDGNFGEKIKAVQNNDVTLSDTEQEILSEVVKFFQNSNTKQIVDISHSEPAWKENESDRSAINYQKYAFDLIAL
ncbi:type II toxin-antitoxin system antitoxin SocA domain-containing protein [Pedobacter sp. N23S346]|uniref:type II toxin-antitoxin system antitoxin SocA domain-containing protein n=1 Tax=Pedobacter sp. N23S346 TaxID=3402750 RepID=UPI003AC63D06